MILKPKLWTIALLLVLAGCGRGHKAEDTFVTSGNRQADQKAEQRVEQAREIRGESEKDKGSDAAKQDRKRTLYERLGGEEGLRAIVDDFTARAVNDPRVNFARAGVQPKRDPFDRMFRRNKGPVTNWQPTPDNVNRFKAHLVQFLALATGGPPKYEGKEMKQAHQGMLITNAQFDAAVGDLKASLDNLHLPAPEQKELLAIVETTRAQVVEER